MSTPREFTPEQRAVIERRDGPLLVSANAGSGKTSVLTERFVRGVLEDGIEPGRMLAITFTDKAAGELRARVRARFAELGAREAARDTEAAWISTIHGFCTRVLRAHAVAAGLDPGFDVLDEAAARAVRAQAFDAALAGFLEGEGRIAALDLVAAWGPDRLRDAIAAVHDELRSRGQTAPRLPPCRPRHDVGGALSALDAARASFAAELAGAGAGASIDAARAALADCAEGLRAGDGAAARRLAALKVPKRGNALKTPAADAFRAACAALGEAVVDAEACRDHALLDELLDRYAAAYAAGKRARSSVDYDDLELHVRDLFAADAAVARSYAERFERIMVDEFQDTNPLQLELLAFLDRDNVFLVGDELQSIYGFRHADVGMFRARRAAHEQAGARATLATNWRSHPELLETINAAFGAAHGDGYVPLVAGREGERGPAPRVELLLTDAAWDDDDAVDPALRARVQAGMPAGRARSRVAEARAVARRVRELVDAGEAQAGEVAILLRAATDIGTFERALELEGLPTLASGGRGYWLRQQVQDLTSYLGALANPRDEEALLGTLGSPLAGLSSDALAHLALGARDAGRPVWAVVTGDAPGLEAVGAADRGRLAEFLARFTAERERAPLLGIDALLARAVEASGYDLHVLALPGGRRRLANVHKLLRLAAAFEAVRGRDLRGFIDHARAEVEAEAREPEAPIEMGDLDAVRLMTIHAAKGLEFGVVFVADLGRQGNARLADLLVDGERVGLRLVRLGQENANALDYEALKQEAYDAAIAEERRVLHVAMTRAEHRLVLSGVARLGEDWPAQTIATAPIAWVGGCLRASLPHELTPDAPELTLDEPEGEWRRRFTARLNTPATAAVRLRPPRPAPAGEEPGAGEQMAFSLDATAPPPAPRVAPAPPTAPATPPGPAAPATLSYSGLARYAECAYRFYLERVLHLPPQEPPAHIVAEQAELAAAAPAAAPGIDPLVRGSIVHRVLELGESSLDAVCAAVEEEGAEATAAELEEMAGLAQAFASTPLAARLAAAGAVHREHAFAFPLDPGDPDGPLINGIVDVLAREPDGGLLVVDYKTNPVAGADLEEVVERHYATQRTIYALAALRTGAPAVEVAYAFLERPGEPVSRTYRAADAAALLEHLRAEAAGLLTGRYPVAPAPHRDLCLTCPGRGGLCSWPQDRVLLPLEAA